MKLAVELCSAAEQGYDCRLTGLHGQLRPLGPQVLCLLGQLGSAALPQSIFAPAAFLLDQLQSSLKAAQAGARRPAFLKSVSTQDAPPGVDANLLSPMQRT